MSSGGNQKILGQSIPHGHVRKVGEQPIHDSEPARFGRLALEYFRELAADPKIRDDFTQHSQKHGVSVAGPNGGESRVSPFRSLDELLAEAAQVCLDAALAAAHEARQARGEAD